MCKWITSSKILSFAILIVGDSDSDDELDGREDMREKERAYGS